MKRYYRSETDKIIAGVCGGLAKTLKVNPLVLRIAFVLAAMINGVGLVAYLLLWLFMAPESSAYGTTDELVRHNAEEMRQRAVDLGHGAQNALGGKLGGSDQANNKVLLIGIALAALGAVVLFSNLGLLSWLGRLWPLVIIAVGAVWLLNYLKDRG